MMKRLVAGVVGLMLILLGSWEAAPAQADEIRSYQVAFTNGMGVRLRTAPYVGAPGIGEGGSYAIPEGSWFGAECEDYGDWVTNVHGESTNVYMRAPGNVWVSTAWLYTGVTFRVGLPLCSELDAARTASYTPKTVADHHREGEAVIMTTNFEQTTSRVYFSKSKTQEAALALNRASSQRDVASTIFCASIGVVTGITTGGASVPAVTAGAAVGFGVDIGCSTVTGLISEGKVLDEARGAANAAATAGKCYEVRMHKDPDTDQWVADVWTVTDHHDYCA